MTCVNKSAVLDMERIPLKIYDQFRTTQGPIVSYLGLTWDYSELGYVKVSQAGMIQDIVARRESSINTAERNQLEFRKLRLPFTCMIEPRTVNFWMPNQPRISGLKQHH
jgi:hypothetical protein